MIPEKEHLAVLENYKRHEQPIYTDSADAGVYVTPQDLNAIRQSVKALKMFYGGRVWTCNTHRMKQAAVNDIYIPFEVEGDMARGVKVSVNVVINVSRTAYARSPKKKYVTIDIQRFHLQTKDVPALLRDEMDQTV